jgi:hypothetical protein
MKRPIYLLNIFILAIYMVLLQGSGHSIYPSFAPIIIHVLANIIIGVVLVAMARTNADAFFLSACLVLLIGFPACLALG